MVANIYAIIEGEISNIIRSTNKDREVYGDTVALSNTIANLQVLVKECERLKNEK